MAMHELGTNAGKHGALSNDVGRVLVAWRVDKSVFHMSWTEDRGPNVAPPIHKGFGQKVIGRMAEASVSGTTEIDYKPSGFTWKLRAPKEEVLESTIAGRWDHRS